jgi:uncharacterized protein (DUF2164 family)
MHKHASLSLSEPARKQAVASLRAYAAENFDDEMSELQATLLLDHVLVDIGPAIYNQAVADARRTSRALRTRSGAPQGGFCSGRRKR